MTQRHAEIAGAGFAGLTAGAALAQRGWSVRVHERAPEAREFGAGIWTWENGLRVLNEIGAADEAFDGILLPPSWESRDRTGKVIDYFPTGTHETGGRLFCITRQQLYSAVLNAALRSGVELLTSSEAVGATPGGRAPDQGRRTLQGGFGHRRRWHQLGGARTARASETAAQAWQRLDPRVDPAPRG